MSIQEKTLPASFAMSETGLAGMAGQVARILTAGALALVRRIAAENRRHRTERQLETLSDEMLKDIGLHRNEVPALARRLSGGSCPDQSARR